VWGDHVIIDQCLQFGWTNSPAIWGVCAAAVEKAHNNTTFDSVEISREGQAATSHVRVEPPRRGEKQARLPPGCVFPKGQGGGMQDPFVCRTYVDDAIFVEPELAGGARCKAASQSYASDCFRALGSRESGEPPLLSREKITSWDTRMETLGWTIDTMKMTIAVPPARIDKLRAVLREWPSTRKVESGVPRRHSVLDVSLRHVDHPRRGQPARIPTVLSSLAAPITNSRERRKRG